LKIRRIKLEKKLSFSDFGSVSPLSNASEEQVITMHGDILVKARILQCMEIFLSKQEFTFA